MPPSFRATGVPFGKSVVARRRALERESPLGEMGTAVEMLRQRMDSRSSDTVGLLEWTKPIPEPKTGPLDFVNFIFQPPMYDVLSKGRDGCVKKATQVGVSALLLRLGMYQADVFGHTVLYVFPTKDDVYDFHDLRVRPMIDASDYLLSRIGDVDNKGQKKVGLGTVLYRGSESRRGLQSVDVDVLLLDEYDDLNQANIPDAERRLSAVTSAGIRRRVGVPSLPQYGISEVFAKSDMREWLVRCDGCRFAGQGERRDGKPLLHPRGRGWQEIDFWENVDQDELAVVCRACGDPLDVRKGVWVAQQPDGAFPGFHVHRPMVYGTDMAEVVENSRKTGPSEVENFYTKDLGLEYVSKDARLSPEAIAAAQREFAVVPGYVGPDLVTMGVDVASERALNVRISLHKEDGRKLALWIGEVEDSDEGTAFEQLDRLMTRYDVKMAGVDHNPETRLARAFANRHPGRAYLVRVPDKQKQVLVPYEEQREVSVRRTDAYDATMELFRSQKNLLPIALPDGYVQQMTAPVRRVEVNELGQARTFWEATRPDDYAQAEVYDMVATEMYFIRLQVDDAMQLETRQLDDAIAYERSAVDNMENMDYRPGPDYGGLGPDVDDFDLPHLPE
jgi:hypothetical protein